MSADQPPPAGAATRSAGESRRRWRLVRTQPQRELTAEAHLGRQGFQVFLPKTLKTVRHARRIRSQVAAFFPGYLFIAIDPDVDRWRSVNGTLGVSYLVMRGEVPAVVPFGVVEDLIACGGRLGLHSPPPPQPGATVRILNGPFSERIALVQRLDANGRVRLLLDIVAGKIVVDAGHVVTVAT